MGKSYFFIGGVFGRDDGHKRITKAENFVVVGGSKEAHEEMADKAIRLDEVLSKREKVTLEVFQEAIDKIEGK